jgi:RNA polymerase sigma factor (sigma-70 family)
MNEEVVLKNLGLINKVIKDMNCLIRDDEDYDFYYHIGLLGLIEASKTYNEEKGKSGYLYKGIKVRIFNAFRYNLSDKRHTTIPDISLNKTINDIELIDLIPSNYNMEEEIMTKVYVEQLLSKLKDKKYKTYLMEYYGIGSVKLTAREIAKKHGVSKQSVFDAINRGLGKLRKEIENEEIYSETKIKMGNKSYKKEHDIEARN